MEKSYQPANRPGAEGPSKGTTSRLWRPLSELGGFEWNPMAWIFLGLFALAEVGNWQMGHEIARVCELRSEGASSFSAPNAAKSEIDAICANRSPQGFYKSR
jgi:hypothetical protein